MDVGAIIVIIMLLLAFVFLTIDSNRMRDKWEDCIKARGFCVWRPVTDREGNLEYYTTECGGGFMFNDKSTVGDNGFEYCPFCGKQIVDRGVRSGNYTNS